MILIYEFNGEEFEFEVPQAMVEVELVNHFANQFEIPKDKANEILNHFDLMDEYEESIDLDDIRQALWEKCEEMALNDYIDDKEFSMECNKDFYYGVNRKD